MQKQVRDVFNYAYFDHCITHRMSLCAAQSANKSIEVAKLFGTLDNIVSSKAALNEHSTLVTTFQNQVTQDGSHVS